MVSRLRKALRRRRNTLLHSSSGGGGIELRAWYSAGVGTVASIANRVPSSLGPLVQATAADRPRLVTLSNGVKALLFDGFNSDMSVPPTVKLKGTGPRWYWAWHVRLLGGGAGVLWSEWSTGGASTLERFKLETNASDNLVVSVAIDGEALATNTYALTLDEQRAGMWLEVLFDGEEVTPADRIRLYVGDAEITRLSNTGVMPALLQAGDAATFWLGSQLGAGNKLAYVAHAYVGTSELAPTPEERLRVRNRQAPDWSGETFELLGWWSGNVPPIGVGALGLSGTVSSMVNRLSGAVAGAFVQTTAANRPERFRMWDATQVVIFDGLGTDLSLPPVVELKGPGPRWYWAMHVRLFPFLATAYVYSEWSTGGASTWERFRIGVDSTDRIVVSVALTVSTFASASFPVPNATQAAGMWLEVLFDGTQAVAADRLQLFVNGAQVVATASSGVMPVVLLPGDAVSFFLGSLNSASRKTMWLAHLYVGSDQPDAGARAALRAQEAPDWGDNPFDLVAWWSGNAGSVSSVTNRQGTTVGPMVQATPADRPTLSTLSNGVNVLVFDGINSDLHVPAVAAMKGRGPRAYWAFHLQSFSTAVAGSLYSEWSTGGASVLERFMILWNAVGTLEVRVASSSLIYASNFYALTALALHGGCWLEVVFDGTEAVLADRIRLYVDGVEVSRSSTSNTMPGLLQPGDAVDYWIGSQTGTGNRVMQLAHVYFGNGSPTAGDRLALRNTETPVWPQLMPSILVSALGSWWQVSTAVMTTFGAPYINSIPNPISGVSVTQSVSTTRAPIRELSGNALPCLRFEDGGTNLIFALGTSTANNTAMGFAFHMAPAFFVGQQTLVAITTTTGASAFKLALYVTSTGALACDIGIAGVGVRRFSTAAAVLTAQAWAFVTLELDMGAAAEVDRVVITVNEVSQTLTASGVSGPVTTLVSATGNGLFGNSATSDAGTDPYSGLLGPHVYALTSKMAGSTGLLSAAARTVLNTWETPTQLVFATPSAVSAVSAWLRVANATLVSGDVSSLPDSLNSNPAVQTVAGRRPTLENSANSLPCMRFATNDVLSWPLITATNNVNTIGWGFWFKVDSVTAVANELVNIFYNSSSPKLRFLILNATLYAFTQKAAGGSPDNGIQRISSNLVAAATWYFLTYEYDSGGSSDVAKMTVTLGCNVIGSAVMPSSNYGSGGAIGVLPTVTGNALLGNINDSGTPANPLNGRLGPNIYCFSSKMTGAAKGLLTMAARLQLMTYEQPT